jgi:RimJ/RimL family protein N-acetyltransferase
MPEYYGTDEQVRLQRRVVDSAEWIAATPGVCNSGRFIGCDDPDRLGWDVMLDILRRDGTLGFRMLEGNRAEALAARLAPLGFRLDIWDAFVADRATALPAAEAVAAPGPPAPLRDVDLASAPGDRLIGDLQSLMAANGVVPFPAALLAGRLAPAALAAVEDEGGRPVAVAFGYLAHNRHSPYHRWAFGGLVAVDPAQRGRGLGRYVNARMVAAVFRRLGAEAVYEMVRAGNQPSCRMVEAAGLRRHPRLKGGIATAAAAGQFTR